MTRAFVYRWIQVSTGKWYVGSRTAEGCHPNDGYICSSDTIKPIILENKQDWKREILAIGLPEDMYELETKLLQRLDARSDPMSFNGHNNDGNYYSPIPWNKGKKGLQIGWSKGLTKASDERLLKQSIQQTGKNNHRFGKKPWNKGLDISNPSVAKYANTLKTSGNRKNKCIGEANPAKRLEVRKLLSEQKIGEKNPAWKGYYVDSTGKVFSSSKEAAREYNVADVSILRWVKNNKNGWKFIPKNLVDSEKYESNQSKGEQACLML